MRVCGATVQRQPSQAALAQPRWRAACLLRVLVFGADSALRHTHTRQLTQAALGAYEPLHLRIVVPQDGYATAYVATESDGTVLFDDVEVRHRPGLQVQETQYDPWGLPLAGLSYSSPGLKALDQYQYNGKETQPELGLGWNDYGARMYSAALGRFTSVDPLATQYAAWSTYLYAANNPLRFMDIDGAGPGDRVKAARAQVAAGNTYRQEGGTLRTASTSAALKHMDCSEFVSRVLAADEITPAVESRNTGALVSYLGNEERFSKSATPHAGDVALWYNPDTGKGHTGLVTAVDPKHPNRFRLAHATYGNNPSQENKAYITEADYTQGHYTLVGYFSPVNETPDGKLDGTATAANTPSQSTAPDNGGNEPTGQGQSGSPAATGAAARFNQYSWFTRLSPDSQKLILDAYSKKNQ